MKKHFDSLRMSVAGILTDCLVDWAELQNHAFSNEELCSFLVEPPQVELGDLAFGCFLLAKHLKKAPPIVAQELADKLKKHPLAGQKFSQIQNVGPYLNLTISLDFLGEHVLDPQRSKTYFKQKIFIECPRTMIEYSQPNTHKELHVGHMRNMCLGDSLIRILRYSGNFIISSTFPGDVGTHVAKCLWYMKTRNQEPIPDQDRGEWLGRMYSQAHNLLEDESGTPHEEKNRQELTAILQQLEAKNGPYYDLWVQTKAWSVELMKKVYSWAGVEFDQWYWESDVDSDSVKYVKQLFSEGKLVESQGAIGMDLESDKLGFCLLLKSDGTGLYATKDLELARRKFNDFHIEKSIYVVDMRQALHFKQVFKVLEHLGFSQAQNCFHLQYNFVELPDGAMSSRKGNIVPILELTKKMESYVRAEFLKDYENVWSAEEVHKVAHQVAQGAIKYGMLRIDPNKKIVFDMKEWLKIDGESGPFIQYSVARINSLIQKLGPTPSQVQYSLLNQPAERQLISYLLQFHWVVAKSAENLSPSGLCTYLYNLAKRFNHFYHECPIGKADNPDLKWARLSLCESTAHVLKQGLELLGIPCPEQM